MPPCGKCACDTFELHVTAGEGLTGWRCTYCLKPAPHAVPVRRGCAINAHWYASTRAGEPFGCASSWETSLEIYERTDVLAPRGRAA